MRFHREEWMTTIAHADVEALAEDLGVATSTLQVVQRRAQRILELPCISADPAQPSLSDRIVDELSNGYTVLVETSGVSSMEEILIASVISRKLLDTYSTAYLDERERFETFVPAGERLRELAAALRAAVEGLAS
jgi:hypothetical protein